MGHQALYLSGTQPGNKAETRCYEQPEHTCEQSSAPVFLLERQTPAHYLALRLMHKGTIRPESNQQGHRSTTWPTQPPPTNVAVHFRLPLKGFDHTFIPKTTNQAHCINSATSAIQQLKGCESCPCTGTAAKQELSAITATKEYVSRALVAAQRVQACKGPHATHKHVGQA
jgi:hypothetical protein